jgi:hypothetical protein
LIISDSPTFPKNILKVSIRKQWDYKINVYIINARIIFCSASSIIHIMNEAFYKPSDYMYIEFVLRVGLVIFILSFSKIIPSQNQNT